jgi:hypothetical protein
MSKGRIKGTCKTFDGGIGIIVGSRSAHQRSLDPEKLNKTGG